MLKTIFRIAAAGILALTAFGLSPAPSAEANAPKILHRGNGAEPSSLDPHQAQGQWEAHIIGEMILGLTTEGPDAKPVPGAATSWTVSPDGLVWTFKLREGATWSDGVPVTADDFVFAWRRLMDPATAAQYASLLYIVKNARAVNGGDMQPSELGVRAVDPLTFEVTLESPAPYLAEVLSHQAAFPVPRHKVEALGNDWVKPGSFVGNGPYMLAEWSPQNYVRVVRSPSFYDAANVKIDEIFFYPTSDSEAALQRFRTGALDMQDGFPPSKIDWLRENLPNAIKLAPYLVVSYTVVNHRRAPFNDVRVREALSLGFDRETLSTRIYRLGEPAAYSLVPPGVANYPGEARLSFADMARDARIARAKELLASAGFGPDNPLSFKYNYINDPDTRRAAAAIQQFWAEIGVKVELQASEAAVHYNSYLQTGDFDVAAAGWVADFNDAENFLFMFETQNEGFNYGGYSSPVYDDLMARSRFLTDIAERGRMLNDAEAVLLADHAIIPTRFPYTRYLVQEWVKGFVPNQRDTYRARWLDIERPGGTAETAADPDASASANAAAAPEEGGGFFATIWGWIVSAWNWFLGLLCSWFGVACPQS